MPEPVEEKPKLPLKVDDQFWEQVKQLPPGQQGVIADMVEAGITLTRQGYAIANWGQSIDELDAEELIDIPDMLPDDPEEGTIQQPGQQPPRSPAGGR